MPTLTDFFLIIGADTLEDFHVCDEVTPAYFENGVEAVLIVVFEVLLI